MSTNGKSHGHCLTEFNEGEKMGMAFVAATGGVSAVAITLLLLLFARNVYRNFMLSRSQGQKFEVIRTHVDAYFLSLLVADLFQSVGALLNVRWAKLGLVHCGAYCNVQGAYKQLGETGVALATMVISIHTFFIIFFRWSPPRTGVLSGVVIGLIWLFLLLFVSLGFATNVDFYTPIPYWCWIGDRYNTLRIVAEYLWIWMAAVLSLFLYPLLFLRLRGNVIVDPENWARISFHLHRRVVVDDFSLASESFVHLPLPPVTAAPPEHVDRTQSLPQLSYTGAAESASARASSARRDEAKLAIAMLGYPACYILLVLPLSITRWMSFVGRTKASFEATATTLALFGLSGGVNVALFMCTRPNLLLFGRHATAGSRRPVAAGSRTVDAVSEPRIGVTTHYPRTSSRESTPYVNEGGLARHRSRETLEYNSEDNTKDAFHITSYLSQSPRSTKSMQSVASEDSGIDSTGKVTVLSDPALSYSSPTSLWGRRRAGSSSAMRLMMDMGTPLDDLSNNRTSPISGDAEGKLTSARRSEGGEHAVPPLTIQPETVSHDTTDKNTGASSESGGKPPREIEGGGNHG